MVKRLDVYLRRHMDSYRGIFGEKYDGPSLTGLAQAKGIGEALRDNMPDGGVQFYTSTKYRTQIAAEIIAQAAGLEQRPIPRIALDPVKRSRAYEEAMKELIGEGGEDARVAFYLRPIGTMAIADTDTETETPRQYADRLAEHIESLTSHFKQIKDGKTKRIENISHEPGLTAIIMKILDKDYDKDFFHGAARTAEAVHFRMEQREKSGVVEVKITYRDISHEYSLRS